MFVIYDPNGRITGTIAGPGRDYGASLDREGKQWLFYEGATTLDIHATYIDTATKSVMACAPIELTVDKHTFIADGKDAAIIKGIPLGANISVLCNGEPNGQHVANDDKLEFASEDAAEFRIFVSCHRFIPASIILTATPPPAELAAPAQSLHVPDYSRVLESSS